MVWNSIMVTGTPSCNCSRGKKKDTSNRREIHKFHDNDNAMHDNYDDIQCRVIMIYNAG